jgi:hypothetical protein
VDEAASRRASGGMALRDWKTGWQGSVGWEAASAQEFAANPIGVAPHSRSCIAVVGEPKLLNLQER